MRNGADALLPRDAKTKRDQHTVVNVYTEMLYQVARDYGVANCIESMTLDRIVFWYAGLRAELRAATRKPGDSPKSKRSKRS